MCHRCNDPATVRTTRGPSHVKDDSNIRRGGHKRCRCVVLHSRLCCAGRRRVCVKECSPDDWRERPMGRWLAWWRLGLAWWWLARRWLGRGCWTRRRRDRGWSARSSLLLRWLLRRALLRGRILCGPGLLRRTIWRRWWRCSGILHATIPVIQSEYRDLYGQRWPSASLSVEISPANKNPGIVPGFSFQRCSIFTRRICTAGTRGYRPAGPGIFPCRKSRIGRPQDRS
jgi:hypothetical protein